MGDSVISVTLDDDDDDCDGDDDNIWLIFLEHLP